jgi:choline kinase
MSNKFLTEQAVILAAGESSRFWPLNYQHKSLIKIMGRPLIWYTIEGLKMAKVKEIIIIQGIGREIEAELKKFLVKGVKIKIHNSNKAKRNGKRSLASKRFN